MHLKDVEIQKNFWDIASQGPCRKFSIEGAN